jgi:hypothetical protein
MLNYHHNAFVAISTHKYSRVLTDNYFLEILDHGQKIFSAPLVTVAPYLVFQIFRITAAGASDFMDEHQWCFCSNSSIPY